MKLLLSNDDGVTAAGIHVLAGELSKSHEVCVSAPSSQQSAVSRAMTLFDPLRADPVALPGLPEVPAYAVTGTPVDCVRLALGNLFETPDMVLSGINLGSNLGTDVLYSGTVAAAHEAALLGYPAIAVSCCAYHPAHLDTAARVAAWAVTYLKKHPLPFGTVLNVNVPDVPFSELRGIKTAPLCVVEYTLKYEERTDPSGRPYYWSPRGRREFRGCTEEDEYWTTQNYAALTPLTYDLTDRSLLAGMAIGAEEADAWKAY